MPIGKVELPVIAPSIATDEESIAESVKGEKVSVKEETKFIPSRLVDKQGRLNIYTKELDWRNPFSFRNALRLRWGDVMLIYITGKIWGNCVLRINIEKDVMLYCRIPHVLAHLCPHLYFDPEAL